MATPHEGSKGTTRTIWKENRFSLNRELQLLEAQLINLPELFLSLIEAEDSYLPALAGWTEVLHFVSQKRITNPETDSLMRAIFLARHRLQNFHCRNVIELHRYDDPCWKTILTGLFARGLAFLHRCRIRHWDQDPNELWCNLLLAFLEAVDWFDVTKHPNHIGKKIMNNAYHRLFKTYSRSWKYDSKILFNSNAYSSLDCGPLSFGNALVELRDAGRIHLVRLHRAYEEGRITKSDFYLISRSRVFGERLKIAAARVGISYELARKRRQRAEAAINWTFSLERHLKLF
jgi:hypothetical protein